MARRQLRRRRPAALNIGRLPERPPSLLGAAVAVTMAAEALLDLRAQCLAVALVRVVPAGDRQVAALRGDEAEGHALVEYVDELGAHRRLDVGSRLAARQLGGQVGDQLRLEPSGVALHPLLDGLVQLAVRGPRRAPVAAAAAAAVRLEAGLEGVALGLGD